MAHSSPPSDGWPVLTLRDAGVRLIDCVHKTPTARASGYPYIGIPQMKGGWLDFENARKISHDDFLDWTKKAKPRLNDVILSRRTNPGVTAIDSTGTEFALGQNLVLLRADGSRVRPAFLKWLVRSPAWWREIGRYINVGAVFDSLKCADIPNFELSIPPLPVQLRTGALLDALDDKIELNRRMNETLETMARTLFKSWFVDFDPVQAKIAGRDTYPSGPISSLFPESLGVDGNPVGWVTKRLDEVATFLNGLALQRFPASDVADSLPVIKITELRNGVTRKSSRASLEVPADYQVHDGDFLFSWSGSLLAKFWTGGPGALNQHLFKVTSSEYPNWFFSQWIYQHLEHFRATAKSKATTMGHIQRRHLSEALTVCPPKPTLEAMDVVFGPMVARIVHNDVESRTLGLVRDALLPKLISGELRVPDAERLVESVT